MILVEINGERMLVKALDGHDGATVIRKAVPEQPSPFHKLTDAGTWVEDAAAKERARVEGMTRQEFIAEILRRVGKA